MPKPKTKQPRWGFNLNGRIFPFSNEENAIVNKHDELWREHCEDVGDTGPHTLARKFHDLCNDASAGNMEALSMLEKFPTREALTRYCRIRGEGKNARFNNENRDKFAETHPIAKRIRREIEGLRDNYIDKVAKLRETLNLSAKGDDFVRLCEGAIQTLARIESHKPAQFERMQDHCHELQPIDE
jgi:hypothetical protein